MLISKGKLIFSPSESEGQVIMIKEEEILSITLKNVKSLEIEIQTWDKIYQGVFCDKADYEELLKQLKENINKKIVCEY